VDNSPLISVIISVFNDEKNIEWSIKSLLNQTYENIEICIIDDGSTDDTYSICSSLNQQSNKIKLFQNKSNQGLTKSLNFLIEKCSGDFIARHDSDDFSHADRIQTQYQYLKRKKLKVCTTRASRMDTDKKIPGISYFIPQKILIYFKNPFIHGTLLIEKKLLTNIGNYNSYFKYSQDYMLFATLIKSKVKIGKVNKVLYDLNMDNNLSKNYKTEQQHFANLVKKYLRESFWN